MRESINKSNIPATFKEVGFNESFHMGKSEKFSYYIDKNFDFWCELEGGEIIKCPSAYRIDAFTFTWSGCRYWYDEETKRIIMQIHFMMEKHFISMHIVLENYLSLLGNL